MKKLLVLFTSLFLVGCSQDNGATTSGSSADTDEIISSEETSVEKKQVLYANNPEYYLESNTFQLSGKVDPDYTITLKSNGDIIEELPPSATGTFNFTAPLPELEDTIYEVSDGESSRTVLIKSKATLEKTDAEKQAEIEAIRKEKQRIQAEKEAEEKALAEAEAAKKAEEESIRKAEDEEKRKKEAVLNNASREQRNALQKAKDYLDYSAFSKSSLYEQLLYEKYPEDAAQFAVDNIEVDWNSEALKKAIDYLDYSSYSDQGLYDQLIYEGFTAEQAQYAIDNLPD